MLESRLQALQIKLEINKAFIPANYQRFFDNHMRLYRESRDAVMAKYILTQMEEKIEYIINFFKRATMGPKVVYENAPQNVEILTKMIISQIAVSPELYKDIHH